MLSPTASVALTHHHAAPASQWQVWAADRPGDPAPGWRTIPAWAVAGGEKIESNWYCRGRNTPRSKYCARRAGAGTDHKGQGRCKLHGGNSRTTTGLYRRVEVPRLKDLLEEAAREPDPLNLLPEVHMLRVLVVDYVNRFESNMEGLLAWHASWSPGHQRPIAEEKRIAFEELVTEFEVLLEESGDPDDPRHELVAKARQFVDALAAPVGVKPRQVPDLGDAHKILATITQAVERIEKAREGKSFSKTQVNATVDRMGVAVVNRLDELCSSLRNAGLDLTVVRDGLPVDGEQWVRQALRRDWAAIIVDPPAA